MDDVTTVSPCAFIVEDCISLLTSSLFASVYPPPPSPHPIFFKHPNSPLVAERQRVLAGVITFSLGDGRT